MKKLCTKFVIIIASIILLMFLPSTTFATINMGDITLENTNDSMTVDLNADLYSSADAISDMASSILTGVTVVGIIIALIPITIMIIMIIQVIKMIITTVKNSKETDKTKIINNMKSNVKRAKSVLNIMLVASSIGTILIIIGFMLITASGVSGMIGVSGVYGAIAFMAIITLIEIIFALVLLGKIYQKYDNETEHALNMQKIVSIFLIVSIVSSVVIEIIVLLCLGNINSIPSVVFGMLLNFYTIIGVILLIDTMKLSRVISETTVIDTVGPKEDLIKGNLKIIVIGAGIILSYLVINGILVYNVNALEKQVSDFNSLISSGNTSDAGGVGNLDASSDDLFDRTQQAATEYEKEAENENQMIQNLMDYVDILIESESNQVSTNTMQDNTVNEPMISNTIIDGTTNNVINIDAIEPQTEKGDINVDGKLSMTDLSLLKGHTVKNKILEGIQYSAADINEDGNITMTDLSRIKLKMVGIE